MKKSLLIILFVFLAVIMTACKKETRKETEENATESTDTSPPADDELKIGGFAAVEIDTGIYYVEAVELKSDPGDNPSALDSAKTAWDAVKESGLADVTEGANVYISLRSVEFINEEDRYVYTVGTGTDYEEGDYTTLYDISVNYAGDVFFLSGESGDWEPFGTGRGDVIDSVTEETQDHTNGTIDPGPGDPGDTANLEFSDPGDTANSEFSDPGDTANSEFSDPGDTNMPEWWGMYKSDSYSVEIYNFNTASFQFVIYNLRNGQPIEEGVAALYPDNPLMAEYGQISFSLYDDYTALDLFVPESSDYSDLRGQYIKLD